MAINVNVQYNGGLLLDIILLTLRDYTLGNHFDIMKRFCPYSQCSHLNLLTIFPLRPFLTRNFFEEIFGLEGSKTFLEKKRQVHNLKISDRLLRSKSFFQENIAGFICSVFRSA